MLDITKSYSSIEFFDSFKQEVHCCGSIDDKPEDGEIRFRSADGGGGSYLVICASEFAIDPNDLDEFLALIKKEMKKVRKINKKTSPEG